MNNTAANDQVQFCPQCDNHCPVDSLKCGRGRKYFGVTDDGHDGRGHGRAHDHGGPGAHRNSLAGLLHQCGRFVRHSELEEAELFQALTGEERAALQAALEKLAASWQDRWGEESLGGCPKEGKHRTHEGHGK